MAFAIGVTSNLGEVGWSFRYPLSPMDMTPRMVITWSARRDPVDKSEIEEPRSARDRSQGSISSCGIMPGARAASTTVLMRSILAMATGLCSPSKRNRVDESSSRITTERLLARAEQDGPEPLNQRHCFMIDRWHERPARRLARRKAARRIAGSTAKLPDLLRRSAEP
jgi:hypothetical protein